jgi:branched-chain amino acid transport system ATP-binding protein
MLEIKDLTVKFGNLVAVNDLNFVIDKNTIHSLIGPNGAGKTTVFNAVYGFVTYTGNIYFEGKDLRKYSAHNLIKLGISRTFQNLSLFYSMTVEQNIAEGLHTKVKGNIFADLAGVNTYARKDVKERIKKVTDLLGITQLLKAYPAFLPYGTQKIVELARVLVSEPKLLMLDEPAAGLNNSEKEYFKHILDIVRKTGVTILLVEHDMGVVMDISDAITVMNFGYKIAEGKPSEIEANPQVIEAYLGV